ncbi:MAG: MATE family efflux transporter [Armatimonadetes bacterium]|nr:MATE family efflux transporter [Armatimonadota bacterium]
MGRMSPPSPRRVDLTQGRLLRGIVLLSWPIVTSSFLQFLMGVADTKMVGALGPSAIAAVGTSRGAIMTLMAAILAVSTGTQVLVARFMGEGRPDRAADVARQAIILSVLLGLVLAPVGWFLAGPIMAALGAKEAVLAQGVAYTRVFFLGAVALMVNFMITAALNGAGDTLTVLYVLAGINAGNILLDWLLIFGVGPFPRLEVAGAAWAVVLSRSVGAVVLLGILSCGRYVLRMSLASGWTVDLGLWGKMFYIGVPNSLQGLTRNLSFLAVLWILNQTAASRLAVAGHTICGQILMIMIVVGLALMSAAMTAVSQNLGAGSPERAERSGWIIAGMSMAVIAVLSAAAIVLARPLVGFFTSNEQAIHWGVVALVTLAAVRPLGAASMAFSGALRGAGDTLSPLWVSLIFTSGVGPGLAYLFTVVLGCGPQGAWAGMAVATVLQALAIGWIFKRGKWKTIKLGGERGEAAEPSSE